MAFWHMQLHPNDIEWKREEELLENFSLIGLGLASEKQTQDFIKKVKPSDIILIRRGSTPIALVKVEGDVEDNLENDFTRLDWFRYRRKVIILDIYNKTKLDSSDRPLNNFPSPRGTLSLVKDKKKVTYQYILNWHRALFPELYQSDNSLKIRKIAINKYKIFNDFEIDFINNGKTLPLIILAGINGSGKTTLLKFINEFTNLANNDRNYIEIERFDNSTKSIKIENIYFDNLWNIKRNTKDKSFIYKLFQDNIVYFPASTDLKDIKEFLPKYIENMIYKEDFKASVVYKRIQDFTKKIFKDLDMLIEFDSRDGEGNLYFKNIKGEIFAIDDISTGEKTLLSKVLYLYIKDIKNKVVLIDEPELSLHPAWQNRVLKLYENFAKNNNCQIIIATHSPQIIGSAKNNCIRLLVKNEDKINAISNLSQTYGLEFSRILTDVMDVKHLRTPDIDEKLSKIKIDIINNLFDNDKFKKDWKDLEELLGKNYLDLKLLKLEIASRRKNVQNK